MREVVTGLVVLSMLNACATEARLPDGPIRLASETGPAESDEYEIERRRFEGPGYVCSWTFALYLAPGETATRVDPGLDFVTFRVSDERGGFVLYEGSAPQEADRLVKTGKQFPSVIAIHLPPERPKQDAAAIADRLVLGGLRDDVCRSATGEGRES